MRDIYKYYDMEKKAFNTELIEKDCKDPEIARRKKELIEKYYREELGILFPDI